MPMGPASVNDVAKTKMVSLGLSEGDIFGYWFDFGDDWWHQVSVMEIKEKAPKGKYPRDLAAFSIGVAQRAKI